MSNLSLQGIGSGTMHSWQVAVTSAGHSSDLERQEEKGSWVTKISWFPALCPRTWDQSELDKVGSW